MRPHRSGWRPTADQLTWPAMSEREAIETVAAGTGVVVCADVGRPAPPSQGRRPPRGDRPAAHHGGAGLAVATATTRRPRPSWVWSRAGPPTARAAEATAVGSGHARARRLGPRPGQPDRRAHRLQRRSLSAARAPAAHHGHPHAARTDRLLSLSSAQERRRLGGHGRGPIRTGWPAYVAGVVAVLRADGHDVPGLDATIDSRGAARAPACPARRRWSARSPSASAGCSASTSTTSRTPSPGRRLHPGRERLRRRAHRRHGPDRGDARPSGPRAAPRLRRRQRDARWRSRSTTPGWRCSSSTPGSATALTDGSYGDRRAECASGGRGARRRLAARGRPGRPSSALDDPVLRRRARHVVTENERVLRRRRGARGAATGRRSAAALDASHASMRDDFEISCRELDLAVETARAARAPSAPG